MKHVLLITAYTEIEHLHEQLALYDSDSDFRVYIHWDMKAVRPGLLESLSEHRSVRLACSRYAINWGSDGQLYAIMDLCQEAVKDLEAEGRPECFIHSVSGTDMLLRSTEETKAFFEAHRDEGFMEHFRLPAHQWEDGGLSRLTLRHPLDRLDIRNSAAHIDIYHRYMNMQRASHRQRPLPGIVLYGGSCWWNLPRDMAEYLVCHANDEGLYDRMKDTFGPEEIHAHTVLLNSPYANRIHSNSLHYMCWDYDARGIPAVLENHDLTPMLQSGNIWARKVATGVSDGIRGFYRWFTEQPAFVFSHTEDNQSSLHGVADYLLAHAKSCPMCGLMDGKMGAAVFLSCYGRICAKPDCVQVGKALLDYVVDKRKEILNADFNNGTLGIAYALGWMVQNGFADSCQLYENVLSAFDASVMQAMESMEARKALQSRFWNNYYRQDLYVRLRKLPCTAGRMDRTSNVTAEQILRAGHSSFKASIGMAGVAGYGFVLLGRLHEAQLPSFI